MIEEDATATEDIYKDLDSPVATKCSSQGYESDCSYSSSHTSIPSNAWMDEDDLKVLSPEPEKDISAKNSYPVLCNEKLKLEEMDLYVELLSDEIANRKSKFMSDPEFMELHEELMKTKTQLSEKEAEVLSLTNQNINLKKNICSLYKTAKAEIEHKDLLLAEANKKVTNYHSKQFYRISLSCRSTQTDLMKSVTETPNYQVNSQNCPGNSKGNHQQSPLKIISSKHDQVQKKRKLQECDSSEGKETVPKDFSLEISKDVGELDSKFILLPEEVKSSFKEHELSYLTSLDKLKRSLINSFLNQSKDQTPAESVSLSTEPSLKMPPSVNTISSMKAIKETSPMPSTDKISCVPKDTPLASDKIKPSSIDKTSKTERAKASKESLECNQGNDRDLLLKYSHTKRTDSNKNLSVPKDTPPTSPSSVDKNSKDEREKATKESHTNNQGSERHSYTKRTNSAHDKHVHGDRAGHPGSSSTSKRDGMYQSDRSRHYYRAREPSVSRTHGYYEQRKKSLYKYSRDRYYSRPPRSPVGKNTSASLTLYKIRQERALKRQLSLSQKELEESNE